jgi:DNA-binding transcriptional MerR regulator
MSRDYQISELAREFDTTARTLRFYEDQGILAPRREGQRRIYGERDRVRLMLALRGKRLGFSLKECREIIDMYDPVQGTQEAQLRYLLDRIAVHRKILELKREDIEATLESMVEIERLCRQELKKFEGKAGKTAGDSDDRPENARRRQQHVRHTRA